MSHQVEDRAIDLTTAGVDEINQRMQVGVQRALAEHRRAGRTIIVWDEQRGEIVETEVPAPEGLEPGLDLPDPVPMTAAPTLGSSSNRD